MIATYDTSYKTQNLENLISDERASDRRTNSEAIESLISEGGESFYKYVDRLGLTGEPDMIVLSSEHHYYYDSEEMSSFKTLINLKELNRIKDLKSFLFSCLHSLPQKSNFIGCFTDNEKNNGYKIKSWTNRDKKRNINAIEHGIISIFPFINMLYSLMDSRIYQYMSKMNISKLLAVYGFQVLDMTEFNGRTFFHSQKIAAPGN